MGGFSRGLLSGVAISGVISALYVRHQQQSTLLTDSDSDTPPISTVTETAEPGKRFIPNDFQDIQKLKYSDDGKYI